MAAGGPAVLQAVQNNNTASTSLAITGLSKPQAGDLLFTALFTHRSSGHISAVGVTDNGSDTGWTLEGPEQASATADLYIAYRVATATDASSFTSVTWGWTGATGSPGAFAEFDQIGHFSGSATFDSAPGLEASTAAAETSIFVEYVLNSIIATPSAKSYGEIEIMVMGFNASAGSTPTFTANSKTFIPTMTITSPTGTVNQQRLAVATGNTRSQISLLGGTNVNCTVAWTSSTTTAFFAGLWYDTASGGGSFALL